MVQSTVGRRLTPAEHGQMALWAKKSNHEDCNASNFNPFYCCITKSRGGYPLWFPILAHAVADYYIFASIARRRQQQQQRSPPPSRGSETRVNSRFGALRTRERAHIICYRVMPLRYCLVCLLPLRSEAWTAVPREPFRAPVTP